MSKRLASAAANGDFQMVSRMLDSGCEVNDHGADGMTALAISGFWGYTDIVNALLRHGSDVNAVNRGTNWTALHCAAFQGHGPVALSLLRAGSDPTVLDAQGRSPADFASAVDAIWPLFAAAGCTRTSKAELIQKRIIVKESQGRPFGPTASRGSRYGAQSYLSRPGSSYVLDTRNLHNHGVSSHQPTYQVAMSGDVLANETSGNISQSTQSSIGQWQLS